MGALDQDPIDVLPKDPRTRRCGPGVGQWEGESCAKHYDGVEEVLQSPGR